MIIFCLWTRLGRTQGETIGITRAIRRLYAKSDAKITPKCPKVPQSNRRKSTTPSNIDEHQRKSMKIKEHQRTSNNINERQMKIYENPSLQP